MLAAIPTHLDENNHIRVKKMSKLYRTKVESESAMIRSKLQQALSSVSSMQRRIRQLENQLKDKDNVTIKQAMTLVGATNEDELTQLTQDDMFEENDENKVVKNENDKETDEQNKADL